MRLLRSIVCILTRQMDRIRHQRPVSNAIASQFVCHDLPGLFPVIAQSSPETPLCGCSISSGLQVHINHFAILVNGSPEIVLLAFDPDKNFIDAEGVAIATMLSLESSGIYAPQLDTPQADRLSTDDDSSLGQ